MSEPCNYRVSVKGIVIDDNGRFLLAKEDNGKWEMMGGGLDHGEDPIECLRREIHEETGLEVTYVSNAPIYFLTAPRQTTGSFTANIIYEIKLKDYNFTPSEECQELRFFNVEEARREPLFPNVEKLLELYKPAE